MFPFMGHFTTTTYSAIIIIILFIKSFWFSFLFLFVGKWVFAIHHTLEKMSKTMKKRRTWVSWKHRQAERWKETHQWSWRENSEGRTGLSDCLQSSRKLLSLRLAAWSVPCKPAQAACFKQCIILPAASVCIFHMCLVTAVLVHQSPNVSTKEAQLHPQHNKRRVLCDIECLAFRVFPDYVADH